MSIRVDLLHGFAFKIILDDLPLRDGELGEPQAEHLKFHRIGFDLLEVVDFQPHTDWMAVINLLFSNFGYSLGFSLIVSRWS